MGVQGAKPLARGTGVSPENLPFLYTRKESYIYGNDSTIITPKRVATHVAYAHF